MKPILTKRKEAYQVKQRAIAQQAIDAQSAPIQEVNLYMCKKMITSRNYSTVKFWRILLKTIRIIVGNVSYESKHGVLAISFGTLYG